MSRVKLHRVLLSAGIGMLVLSGTSLLITCGSASDDLVEEEPPVSASARHGGGEGKMGKPTSAEESGLYAMKGPKQAIPQMARSFDEKKADAGPVRFAGKGRKHKRAHRGLAAAVPAARSPAVQVERFNSMPTDEAYDRIVDNVLTTVADDPRSTFSIDVDTAAYSNARRFIERGSLPPMDSVRVEEMINYFDYAYDQPVGDAPFSVTSEVGPCPWNAERKLVHVGLQGKIIAPKDIPPRNLVFLLDVSGSMGAHNKLPLVKRALTFLTEGLGERDRVSIVVYAGAAGMVLPPTAGSDTETILRALERLDAGGSTNGGEGIHLAYDLATRSLVEGGVNRVILATDGDFNVGTTSRADLMRLIEDKRETGVYLSVLGFGMGNLQDGTMEQLADKGNGNYAYIDTVAEARKVLVEQAGATLITIAKDVKIQAEFNPRLVSAYRLVGYENRKLAHRDFNDDTKDAGEIGAGHTVTALYEIVPAGDRADHGVDPLKYQASPAPSVAAGADELMTVKLRYKHPDGDTSKLLTFPIADAESSRTSDAFRFSAAVAGFGRLLRRQDTGEFGYGRILTMADGARGADAHCYRAGFVDLVQRAAAISGTANLPPVDPTACSPTPAPGLIGQAARPTVPTPTAMTPVTATTHMGLLAALLAFLHGLPTFIHFVPGVLALPLLLLANRARPRS